MKKIIPIKRLGQNYLKDKNIIDKIVREIDPGKNDQIIEIGPGQGAITDGLIETNNNLTLVEIDRRVVEDLQDKFPSAKFIEGDFLKIDLAEIIDNNLTVKVIGNIPYNITSPILFKLLESRDKINESVLLVQDEVAKRITAEPKTKEYGILSIIMSQFSEVKYCFSISPNVFFPKPKVNSAVIHIYFNRTSDSELDEELFIKLVKASFRHRRKTLKNSLSNSIFGDYDFSGININFSKRAEELTVSEFVYLTKMIQPQIQ